MNNIVLNPGQERVVNDAVNWYFNSSNQVFEISGWAGVGKSVVLHEIINRIGLKKNEYIPMAYTGQAACVMRTKGFNNAKSIHSSLYELIKTEAKDYNNDPFAARDIIFNTKKYCYTFRAIPPGMLPGYIKLFVIDEGYMVPSRMVKDILSHGIKVLVAGDSGQLPPIGDDPGFLVGDNVHYLTEIMRQEANNPILYLAARARNNEPIHCGLYGSNALVIEDKDLTMDMIMNVGNIVCATNKTRDIYNNGVRKMRGFQSPYPQYTDKVICRANNWDLSVDGIALCNGLTGYVVSPMGPERMSYGKRKNNICMDFLPDLLQRPFLNLEVNKKYIVSNPEEKAKIKQSRYEEGELFEFAYCLTTHLSQGAEYPSGILIEEFLKPSIQNQLIYTGITRFKQYLIYVIKTKKYF